MNDEFVKKEGKRKAFHAGGNSSCRSHIRQHYELYKQRCEEKKISENHYAIPRILWKQMEEEKRNPKSKKQKKLDGAFEKVQGPREFTREGVLHAISQFVAVDDQV